MKTSLAIFICIACASLSGCMSQEAATRLMTHEFIRELPNQPGSDIRERVVTWIARATRSTTPAAEYQDRETWSIVTNSVADITPEGRGVNMRVGFTMSVDVKNERMRIRFTNLRRVYGSKKYDAPLHDEFFTGSTALPYLQAAQMRFNLLVRDLTEFIEHGSGDVATTMEDLHALQPVSR